MYMYIRVCKHINDYDADRAAAIAASSSPPTMEYKNVERYDNIDCTIFIINSPVVGVIVAVKRPSGTPHDQTTPQT